ncbi:5-hydroxytryptamine receptor 2B-like [Lepisosteus oculatus]|uniref:5-hydroxytryptamine receptor 2B-like n=1 Tax=Lepisosteus oculatus TaxID=7918 RepID=UPI003717FA21
MDGGPWELNSSAPATLVVSLDALSLLFNCCVLGITFLAGMMGNLLVCWAVYRNKSLQTANNTLLVNLAANDLLKCSLDIPLFMLASVFEKSRLEAGETLCCLHQFTYSLSSCVQLLTLVIISAERFQAIAFPFETDRRKLRIKAWLLVIWAVGFLLGVLSVTLSKDTLFYMMCRHLRVSARSYFDPFGIYVLVPVWMFSLTLIIVHYMRIFVVVRQHANKVFDVGIPSRPRVGNPVSNWSVTAPDCDDPKPPGVSKSTPASLNTLYSSEGGSVENGPGKAPDVVGAICLLTPSSREHAKKRMEGKLAKRFGYIIIAFLVFWAPMVVILLMNVLTSSSALLELELSAMVLTCVPAAINPLIYTVVNHQFRSEFGRVFSTARSCLLGWRG